MYVHRNLTYQIAYFAQAMIQACHTVPLWAWMGTKMLMHTHWSLIHAQTHMLTHTHTNKHTTLYITYWFMHMYVTKRLIACIIIDDHYFLVTPCSNLLTHDIRLSYTKGHHHDLIKSLFSNLQQSFFLHYFHIIILPVLFCVYKHVCEFSISCFVIEFIYMY